MPNFEDEILTLNTVSETKVRKQPPKNLATQNDLEMLITYERVIIDNDMHDSMDP